VGSLGDFGVSRPPLDLSFGWFGATIRVNPRASDLSLTEFMAAAEGIEIPDTDDFDDDNPTPEQMRMMANAINAMSSVTKALQQFMRDQIHPDDWPEFNRLAKENGQQNADLLAVSKSLAAAIAEHVAGFPTGQSSDSPPSPGSARPRSSDGSSSAGARSDISARERRRREVQSQAMQLLPGRPDLRLALARQQQSESEEVSA
jgi:hypothetical protein